MPDFDAHVRDRDGTPVIDVHGDLDGDAGDALADAYDEAVADDPDAVVMNFDDLGFMNSSGIALVVSLLGRARQHDIDFRACGLNDHYRHVFEITRLSDFISMETDEAAAVRAPEGAAR